MTHREKMEAVISLVGVPYVYGSSDLAVGLDCLTLAAEVYRRIGLVFPLPDGYSPDAIPTAAFANWARNWQPCMQEPWSVVDMRPSHCGVFMPDGRVIHCRDTTGVVIQPLMRLRRVTDGFWKLRARDDC